MLKSSNSRCVIVHSISLIGGLLVHNSTYTAAMAISSSSSSSSTARTQLDNDNTNNKKHHAGASPHWEALWAEGLDKGSRFDVAGVSLPLVAELARRRKREKQTLPPGLSALIPGSGRAYDALALAEYGFASVTALDVSPTACAAARKEIAAYKDVTVDDDDSSSCSSINVVCGDFFEHEGHYDFIWDNTFLCALDPSVRERWALQMKTLLQTKTGELLTNVFPIGDREGGPPFALSVPLVTSLLEPVGFQATFVQDQLPLEQQHRRPGDPLESVRTRGSALVTWRISSGNDDNNNSNT